ncbi:uncharacterized protein L201_004177 [Kwoniella dendrophila CBS 6074]|uniref:CTLH domain-containing protein n=1 Tax=Kwoniella dendrophila CBS 6074 TaxID=1295534 RepID=A0AAX4JVI1_9TREE
MNGSSSSSSTSNMSSLHDVIMNYVETSGYASTARILCKTKSKQNNNADTEETNTNTNGDGNGNRETDNDMEVDDDDGTDETKNSEDGGMKSNKEGIISIKKAGKLPIGKKAIDFDEVDLENIEKRRTILDHILNGSISKSVELLNEHFPAVLNDSSESSSSSSSSSITNGNSSIPYYRYNTSTNTTTNHSIPVLYKSTEPSHVKLNLQIQQFIEYFRQLNPSSSTSTFDSNSNGLDSSSSPSSSIGSLSGSTSSITTNGNNSNSSNGNLINALSAAQGLHSEAKKLPAEIRAIYLQEIKDVGALFAYTNPEQSILKGFLDQNRRIKLSEMINSAILKSQNKSTESALETFARRTTVLYKIMNNHGIDSKPSLTTNKTTSNGNNDDGKGGEHLAEYWKQSNGRPFNLHEFVHSSW